MKIFKVGFKIVAINPATDSKAFQFILNPKTPSSNHATDVFKFTNVYKGFPSFLMLSQ